MKNKILLLSFIMTFLTWSGVSFAVGQGNVEPKGVSDEATVNIINDDIDQDEDNLKGEENQSDDLNQNEKNRGQDKKVQAQNQNEQNIEEDQNQNKNEDKDKANREGELGEGQDLNTNMAKQRRSEVANAVELMLQVADREGGIGEQVRLIAQNQNKNQEEIENNLEQVENRGGVAKFLIGPNYGQINKAEKLLEQNRENISQLNEIKTQLTNEADAQIIANQIEVLEQANVQIENSLKNAEKGFSLFGWMFKLLSK
jgi:hypothetical protein